MKDILRGLLQQLERIAEALERIAESCTAKQVSQ